jgi:small subunit ribosomal protein S8
MAQDKVADALNMVMNARRANKEIIEVRYHSKLLISVLAIAKLRGYIKDYRVEDNVLKVTLGTVRGINAIKPRYVVPSDKIEKYALRYLPAKNLGAIVVSTSQGIMTHTTAVEKNLGGALIAYMY